MDTLLSQRERRIAPPHLDPESCYRAISAKDARFDGVFFTGVKTTGIYCRPVCGVKVPRQSSCEFFASAAAAEAAGFRPCLRCRPELAPYALQQNLAFAVWQRIAAGAMNLPDGAADGEQALEKLAAEVGLSSRQLRRILVQHFGVTPVELAQTQRLLFAKKLLQETSLPMAEVAFAAGFGSVRRFNALFASRYGMAPGMVRRETSGRAGRMEHDGSGDGESLTLRLAYRPPYAWNAILAYLAGRAIPGVESVSMPDLHSARRAGSQVGSYLRSVRHEGVQGWLRLSHLPQRNQLMLEVSASLATVLMPLLARVRNQFDLDANPSIIESHLAEDPLLAPVLHALPGMRVPGAYDPFELAVRAILGQQVSVAGATTLSGRLAARFGTAAATPAANVCLHFPEPSILAGAEPGEIAQIGLPLARARTIQALARFAADGGLGFTPGMTLDDAVTRLKSVPGIGEWTAQYIALRALRFPDAFPAGDLGLQKAAAREQTQGQSPTPPRLTEKALLARAARWSPWRGYAALLLWHALAVPEQSGSPQPDPAPKRRSLQGRIDPIERNAKEAP